MVSFRTYRAKRWLCAFVLLGLVLLSAVEATLRFRGYGYSVQPFLRKEVNGSIFYVNHYGPFRRFLQGLSIQLWGESEVAVPSIKAPHTYRIFAFGGGQAVGWPNVMFGYPRIIEAFLRARYPGIRFEVYNVAYPFTNSHTALDIASGCASLQPDMFLLYLGGNELIGPYGPYNVAARGVYVPSRFAIALDKQLYRLRCYQWLVNTFELGGKLTDRPNAPPDVKERAYKNFAANVEKICHIAQAAGAAVVLCTEGANLRDWPPPPPNYGDVNPQDSADAAGLRESAASIERTGDFTSALGNYEKAMVLTPRDPMTVFMAAKCLLKLGDIEGARKYFDRALELDSGHMARARPQTIEVCRDIAQRDEGDGVYLADTAARFSQESRDGIPGNEFFLDNCHPNFHGAYLIACTIFEQLEPALPDWVVAADIRKPGAIPLTLDEAKEWLGLTPAAQLWPMRTAASVWQSAHLSRFGDASAIREQLAEIERSTATDSTGQIIDGCRRALAHWGNDFFLSKTIVTESIARGPQGALSEAQSLAEAFPERRSARRLLARTLVLNQQWDAAASEFLSLLELYPDDSPARLDLARLNMDSAQLEPALDHAREAWNHDHGNSEAKVMEADILVKMSRLDEAQAAYLEAVELSPSRVDFAEALDSVLVARGDASQRRDIWKQLADKYPLEPPPLLKFAQVSAETNELGTARQYVERAREHVSGNPEILGLLGKTYLKTGDITEAVQTFELVFQRNPNLVSLRAPFALALQAAGDTVRANEQAEICRRNGIELPAEFSTPPVATIEPEKGADNTATHAP